MIRLWPEAAALLAMLPYVLVGFFSGDLCGDNCDCSSCTIYADDFSYPDQSPLPDNIVGDNEAWIAKAGTIAVVSGQASCSTAKSVSVLKVGTSSHAPSPFCDTTTDWRIGLNQEADVTVSGSDEAGFLIGSYITGTIAVLLSTTAINCYTISTTGAWTPLISFPISGGGTHRLGVFWANAAGNFSPLVVYLDGAEVNAFNANIVDVNQNCGLISGQSNSGTVTWDNFKCTALASPLWSGATSCTIEETCLTYCSCCEASDDAFTQWEVIIGGGSPLAGMYYPQRANGTNGGGDGNMAGFTNPRAWDNCGYDAIPATCVLGELLVEHNPLNCTSGSCCWRVTFGGSVALGSPGGTPYVLDPGVGGCAGTVQTLFLQDEPTVNAPAAVAARGWAFPSTLSVEGIP